MIGPATGTERHLPILILLVRVWGALSMMIGVSMLLLAVGAVAILMDPAWPREAFGTGITVGAFAVVFGVLGAFALAWGAAHLWAGTLLRDHRPDSYPDPFGSEPAGVAVRDRDGRLCPVDTDDCRRPTSVRGRRSRAIRSTK